MTNFQIQQALIETLEFMEYWSTINVTLFWLFIILLFLAFVSTLFVMAAGDVEDFEAKDLKLFYKGAYSAGFCAVVTLVALLATPSGDSQKAKLSMYSSQLVTDQQACSFLRSLKDNNRTFSMNVTLPPECRELEK